MKIAILNYATVDTFEECKDMPLWELMDSDIMTFAQAVLQEVCSEANLPEALTNLKYNVSEEVAAQMEQPDAELVWTSNAEGFHEGHDSLGILRAVITVAMHEV